MRIEITVQSLGWSS